MGTCIDTTTLASHSVGRVGGAPAEGPLIPTLDGWRCIAISFVLFSHGYTWLGFGTARLARLLHYPGIAGHIERTGSIGVNIFFCISGFLITSQLMRQGGLRRFYVRRAFRILPPALLYLVVVATLAAVGFLTIVPHEILACLLFVRNYLDVRTWFTGHFWSLSMEEQFYLLWPFILASAGFLRSRRFCLLALVCVVVWRQMHWPLHDFAYFHTTMRLDGMICGSVMALSWDKLKIYIKRTPSIVVPAGAVIFFVVDAYRAELQSATDLLQAALICLLIASTVTFPLRFASRILELPVVVWVGRLSYSVYLWQQLFLQPSGSAHWQFPLRYIGILGAAWLSYTFVESPSRALGRRLSGSVLRTQIVQAAAAD